VPTAKRRNTSGIQIALLLTAFFVGIVSWIIFLSVRNERKATQLARHACRAHHSELLTVGTSGGIAEAFCGDVKSRVVTIRIELIVQGR